MIIIFFFFGFLEENADRNIENLREFYRYLLRRNSLEGLRSSMSVDSPYEHLMIRKSQRSPSLRLRFGRSDPMIPKVNYVPVVTSVLLHVLYYAIAWKPNNLSFFFSFKRFKRHRSTLMPRKFICVYIDCNFLQVNSTRLEKKIKKAFFIF